MENLSKPMVSFWIYGMITESGMAMASLGFSSLWEQVGKFLNPVLFFLHPHQPEDLFSFFELDLKTCDINNQSIMFSNFFVSFSFASLFCNFPIESFSVTFSTEQRLKWYENSINLIA